MQHDILTRLLAQQRLVCECGRAVEIYADDAVTPLCARCWMAIYRPDVVASE